MRIFRSPTETGFGGTAPVRSRRTPVTVIEGDASDNVSFRITQGNVLPELQAISTVQAGTITFTYVLKNPRATLASIKFQYSVDGGETYQDGTSAGDDSGVDNLTTSASGETKTFKWNSTTATDIGIDFIGSIFVRIRAYDQAGYLGDFEDSSEQKVSIDNAPVAPTIVAPTSGFFTKDQTIQFVAEIPDPSQGDSDLHVILEIDPSTTYDSANGEPFRRFESRNDQVGWEYDSDGAGAWVDVPSSGIPIVATSALVGNQCRYTIQTEDRLPQGDYNGRMIFAGVTT